MKVNMNIPDDLLKRLDEEAKRQCVSRSAFICTACNQYLATFQFQNLCESLISALNRLRTPDNDDKATVAEIEKIISVIKIFKPDYSDDN